MSAEFRCKSREPIKAQPDSRINEGLTDTLAALAIRDGAMKAANEIPLKVDRSLNNEGRGTGVR